ncbi:MAG: hypothetical protein UX18_C0038G0009 [Candidatus Azambacteria bacterium GW2011_GWC2_45_7b]|uniref:Histidine kinase N-terminal 7TM region domain-containing protein n=4 Tax=Parcubacteria group TaxID=1794811 RepID=A0A837IGA8_9BACT|nr:MAG: hypothetical protein UW15_C0014G0033 [Parcubacteria group bacterium GW2011_GWC1_44_10]KKT57089.1 MAG: hypothetical protein UW49_C0008G0051 [Candidatus Giovannonibacteria bacterium GW2011_GWB1_44_23]KKT59526.1 MAG: hypothetical protein UW53_C0011G0055 [Candidatus Giovannonibacteria bacterium GW2011_GWA1_44_25]KKU11901.1 MAG: hypothetical protein UX18_C0038G0009 [Candidatus Azambacteria bacterium GW2011_GWC2_45_7b]
MHSIMIVSTGVILPALALILGVFLSAYLVKQWVGHPTERRPRFFLFWAAALFLMYWFQIPMILANLGRAIRVKDFNLFFALTLPIAFLALVFLYIGLVDILEIRLKSSTKFLLTGYFLAAVIFFAYHFIARGGIIETYSLPLIGNLVFYLPIRLLIIFVLAKWLMGRPTAPNLDSILGAAGIMGESVLGIIRNILIIKNVLAYPPEFWYVVLVNLRIFFILQIASLFLLILGIFFLHREYCRRQSAVMVEEWQ